MNWATWRWPWCTSTRRRSRARSTTTWPVTLTTGCLHTRTRRNGKLPRAALPEALTPCGNRGYTARVAQSQGEEGEDGDGDVAAGAGADQAGWLLGGFLVLGEAWVYQLRGACWSDRDHAPRAGGEEAVGLGGAVPEDAQLLHALARSRGAAGCDLHRVEAARYARRDRGRLLLRGPLHLRFVAALLPGRGPLGRARDHGPFVRHTA